jgi:hypothetical protein
MPTLITQPDGSVLWDYDVPEEKPKKKAAAKKAAEAPKTEES